MAEARVHEGHEGRRAVAATARIQAASGEFFATALEDFATILEGFKRSGTTQYTNDQERLLRSVGSFVSHDAEAKPLASMSGAAQFAAMMSTSLSTREIAAALRISDGRARQRAGDDTLYSLKDKGSLRFPRFQLADDGSELPGWATVAPAFPASTPAVAVARFMDAPRADLPDAEGEPLSPRQWLSRGEDPAEVVALIEDLKILM